MSLSTPLITVDNLVMHFPIYRGVIRRRVGAVHAVDGVSFVVHQGETLGLVGESGCGKSTTGRTILQLYRPTSGKVFYKDKDLTTMKPEAVRMMRREMQMIFQDPYASLNPRMTVRDIIGEPLMAFGAASGKEIDERVAQLLKLVKLNPDYGGRYPHEFSGGQRQRIGVARALAMNPSFIVCDEPISALDVSIQAQVVNLLEDLQKEFNLTYLFIAHDLSMVRHISDRVAVMYLGKIMELTDRNELYANPLHPYTQALLSAIPVADPVFAKTRRRQVLQGDVPSPVNPPSGCRFRTRCPIAIEYCAQEVPEWREIRPGHFAACHRI
jgi:oligopeptide transport system ATP-binding protein